LFCCYAAGGGGGQADTEDVARLHVELETKDQELHEKNQLINQLVSDRMTLIKNIHENIKQV